MKEMSKQEVDKVFKLHSRTLELMDKFFGSQVCCICSGPAKRCRDNKFYCHQCWISEPKNRRRNGLRYENLSMREENVIPEAFFDLMPDEYVWASYILQHCDNLIIGG